MSTYSHVLDILDATALQAGKARAPMHWLRARPVGWVVVLFQFNIVRRANRNTREVEEMGLFLSGIARRLPKIASEISPADLNHFLKSAVDAEEAYLRMRKEVMDMLLKITPIAAKHPKIAQSFGAWIEALADAFEAAQDLRWVVMECQAQQDMDAGRVQRFGTAAAAIAALRS